MLVGIRHTAALLLGLVLLAMVIACGGEGPSEADIDATVEPRVAVERAVAATVEAVPTATLIVPTPTPLATIDATVAVDYQATVVALTAYWPTMDDLTLMVSHFTPSSQKAYLEYVHVFSGVYVARECLAGRERSSEDFRDFLKTVGYPGVRLNKVGHRALFDMVDIAKERIEADLPPAKFGCMRPFMYPETGEEAMFASGLAAAAINHDVALIWQRSVLRNVQADTAKWLGMESPETPLLLWLYRELLEP